MAKQSKGFSAILPQKKPNDIPLSRAMKRLYDVWPAPDDRRNEFFSNFKYSCVTGIGKGDGDASRRDPSKVLKVNGTYYVWYTRRKTESDPVGMADCTDDLPAVDWDLADICYATSQDGFQWEEQGVAVSRSGKGVYGARSLSTPDILAVNGKYYLYYQTFTERFRPETGDYCDVSMAWADSPDGPWHKTDAPVVELGAAGEWDERAIHDPFPLVYKGKIWLYYKGAPFGRGPHNIVRAQGVAIADSPEGPFTKPAANPVINSGHETFMYPYKEGIAAVVSIDGPEKNTVQYAPDGLNFEIKSMIQLPPIAAGPFCPDAFADNGDGQGVSWGLSHVTILNASNESGQAAKCSYLVRFDCDLHRRIDRQYFKSDNIRLGEASFFQKKMTLSEEIKTTILKERATLDTDTIVR